MRVMVNIHCHSLTLKSQNQKLTISTKKGRVLPVLHPDQTRLFEKFIICGPSVKKSIKRHI